MLENKHELESKILFKKTDGTDFGQDEQELLKAHQEITANLIKESINGFIKPNELEKSINEKLKDQVSAETIENIKEAIIEQKEINKSNQISMQAALERLSIQKAEAKDGMIDSIVKAAKANKDAFSRMAHPDANSTQISSKMTELVVKAPILAANVVGGRETQMGISILSEEMNRISSLIKPKMGKPGTNKVTYYEKRNPLGNAVVTAEGALKTPRTFDIVEQVKNYSKLALSVKTSIEVLLSEEDMEKFIREDMFVDLENSKDAFIISAIDAQASAFTITTPVVANPNRKDVIRFAQAQIRTFKHMPNSVGLNPIDAAEFESTKGADGHYLFASCVNGNTMSISTLPVFESTDIPYGTFFVGDLNKVNVQYRPEVMFFAGYENDDLTKNMVTFVADCFIMCYIKYNDTGAVVMDTFANGIAAIS
jgi:hypothetical protein